MSGAPSHPRSRIGAISIPTVAPAIVLAAGPFIAIAAIFDLATDAAGKLPGDHSATFTAVTGTSWQQAASVAHPVTPYVTHAEAGYAAFELLFGVLFLVVAAISLRRAERWAWWCSWLLILGAYQGRTRCSATSAGSCPAAAYQHVVMAWQASWKGTVRPTARAVRWRGCPAPKTCLASSIATSIDHRPAQWIAAQRFAEPAGAALAHYRAALDTRGRAGGGRGRAGPVGPPGAAGARGRAAGLLAASPS